MHAMQGVMPSSHWAIDPNLQWALCLLLLLLTGAMHHGMWWGEDNLIYKIQALEADVVRQQQENARLQQRNQRLVIEVLDLKEGLEAIEERARNELGMIREGEIFYRMIEPATPVIPVPLVEPVPEPLAEALP